MGGTLEERARALHAMDRSRSPGLGFSRPRTPDRGGRSFRGQGRQPTETERWAPGHLSRGGARRLSSERERGDEGGRWHEPHAERLTKSGGSWRAGSGLEGLQEAGSGAGEIRESWSRADQDPRSRVRHSGKAGPGDRRARAHGGEGIHDGHSGDELRNGRLTHDSVGSVGQKQGGVGPGDVAYSKEIEDAKLEAHPRGGSFYNPDVREEGGTGGSFNRPQGRERSRGGSRKPKKSGARTKESARSALEGASDLSFKPGRESTGSPDMFSPTMGRTGRKSGEFAGRGPEQLDSDWRVDSRARSPEPHRRTGESHGARRRERDHHGNGFDAMKSAPDLPRSPYSRREERPRSPGQYPMRGPSPFELKTAPNMHSGSGIVDVQDIMSTNDMLRSTDLRWDFLQSTDVCWDLNSRDAERMTPGLQARWTESGRPGVRHRSPSIGAQPMTPPGLPRMPSKSGKKMKPKAGFIAKMLAGCCRPEAMYEAPEAVEAPQQRQPSFAQRRPPPENERKEVQRFVSRQRFMVGLIEEDRLRPAGSGRDP